MKLWTLLAAVWTLLATVWWALSVVGVQAHQRAGEIIVRNVQVHDGDTFFADLPCTIPVVCTHIGVRISNIDTPEIGSPCAWERSKAAEARDALARLLRDNPQVRLVDPFRDKYFRINAVVMANGINVGKYLLDSGLARAYGGEKKEPWPKCTAGSSSSRSSPEPMSLIPDGSMLLIPDGWGTYTIINRTTKQPTGFRVVTAGWNTYKIEKPR